jgi:hypothetical protein
MRFIVYRPRNSRIKDKEINRYGRFSRMLKLLYAFASLLFEPFYI